jgi:xanthine dehydrogenase molybdopterin binding subunit
VMLEMWPVTVPHAHARITRLDTTAASAMPGVMCILTAADVPGHNDTGAIRHDEPLFAKDVIQFHGQMVAVVIGKSYEECRAAAAKVVVEVEPLPAILGIEAAIAQESFHSNPHIITRGNVDEALAKSPRRLTGDLHIGGQEHFYLEAHAAWAEVGDDGDVRITSSTQHPSEVQAIVSHVLDLPRNRVVVEAPRMGGGFGGKETQGAPWAAICALAAWKCRLPVRVQLDRDLDLALTGKRHPFYGRFEVGFDDDGRIHGAKIELTSDGGFALDLSESISDRALFHLDNAYYLPQVRLQSRVAKTNTVSHTAFRGFGGPQGMVVIEEVLDRIARTLGLAPEVVRERNLYRGSGESNRTHYGQDLGDERIPAIWSSLLESAELKARRAEIQKWNDEHPWIKRGIAMTPVKFGISFTATFLNQAGALVLIYRDGTVQVNHGGTEMGQGLYTKIRGIAMRELGISAAHVRVMKTVTDKVPNTSATAASSGSDLNGQAVLVACQTLRERLAPVAQEIAKAKGEGSTEEPIFAGDFVVIGATKLSFAEVVEKAYLNQVSLSTTGFYRTPGIGYDRVAGKGKPFYYFAYGAAVSEVELDGYSGMKRLLRTDILQDVGTSLNPSVDRGQIEGAFVQGVGWLTGEELLWDEKGRLLSHSASTYQIPAISDAPIDLRVELLPNAAQDGVVHGSKAVGEPPLMLAISVREALREAVAAFGGEGPVTLACPATHEALYAAIRLRLGDTGDACAAPAEGSSRAAE